MLKDPGPHQNAIEMVTLEELVPQDHLLRQIDRHIDFSFIHEEVKHLYCANNGRPAIDPTVLFKTIFIGYLFGIRSERQLVGEVEVNVAYRWFLGLGLTEKVMDASTLSQNRRRRFSGSDIEQVIFDKIVDQAIRQGLIGGQVLYTDSTHLKANANKHRHSVHEVAQTPMGYLSELNEAIDEDRARAGKKPLKHKDVAPEPKATKVSDTDADAGYMYRDNKPEGFFYLDHRTVDSQHNLITDTYVTPGNVHDSRPYLDRLDRQGSRFGLHPQWVGLDAGYSTAAVCHGLDQRGIEGVMGYKRPHRAKGMFSKRRFKYDAQRDVYVCPANELLAYTTTNRLGYREYKSDARTCADCALLSRCTRSRNHRKVVVRHLWEGSIEQVDRNRISDWGKHIYGRRSETVERSFADAKQLHGHRYARFRGRDKVMGQCLLSAACQNMKKIARLLAAQLRILMGWQRYEVLCRAI